jgi:hypothetical protein
LLTQNATWRLILRRREYTIKNENYWKLFSSNSYPPYPSCRTHPLGYRRTKRWNNLRNRNLRSDSVKNKWDNSLCSTKKDAIRCMALKSFVFPNWHPNISSLPFLTLMLVLLTDSVKKHARPSYFNGWRVISTELTNRANRNVHILQLHHWFTCAWELVLGTAQRGHGHGRWPGARPASAGEP